MLNACQQMARQGRKRSQFIWYFFHDIRINKNTNSFSEQVRPDRRTCVLNLTWRVSGGFGHRTFRKRLKKASDGSFHPGLFFGLLECSFTIWRLTYFFSDLISGFFDKNRIAVGRGASNIKKYLARQLMACKVLTPLPCNGCDYDWICFLTGHLSVHIEFSLAVWRLIPVGNGI